MRSSKSRSRSKNNRNRSVGNIMNRVFDSSGPEGKVRGTPQQIIEKYNQLARDAQLSNDVVAAENFQQHAEHYTRLLGEAQREMEARREAQEREQRERQQARADQPQGRRGDQQNRQQPRGEAPAQQQADSPLVDPILADQPDVLAPADEPGESILVETPEEAPPKPRRSRKPRSKAEDAVPPVDQDGEGGGDQRPEASDPPDAPDAPKAAE